VAASFFSLHEGTSLTFLRCHSLIPSFVIPLDSPKPSLTGLLQLDYRRIATFYGQGATYDAIEGRFRVVRKEAQALKDEAAAAGVTDTPRGRPKPATTARSAPARHGSGTPARHGGGTASTSRKRTSPLTAQRVDHGRIVKTPTHKPARRPGLGSTAANAIRLDAEDDEAGGDEMMGAKVKAEAEQDEDADGESDAPAYSFEDDGYATGNGLMEAVGLGGWHGYDDDFPEEV